jgi:hypothetical protein
LHERLLRPSAGFAVFMKHDKMSRLRVTQIRPSRHLLGY